MIIRKGLERFEKHPSNFGHPNKLIQGSGADLANDNTKGMGRLDLSLAYSPDKLFGCK